jgi:hypothetical protein
MNWDRKRRSVPAAVSCRAGQSARRPGAIFERKIVSTKEEWDVARRGAKDKTDGIEGNRYSRGGAAGR